MGLKLFKTGIRILKREWIPISLPLSDYNLATGECTIEYYVASKDPYRQAPIRQIPTPWPCESSPVDQETGDFVERNCAEFWDILQQYEISARYIQVANLSCTATGQSQDTIIITTTDENTEKWKDAATFIQANTASWLPESKNLAIEIRNEDKMCKDYISFSPLRGNWEISTAASEISRFLPRYLERFFPGAWSCVTIYSKQLDGQLLDSKPTIGILFMPGMRAVWSKVEQDLKETIESMDLPDPGSEFLLEIGVGLPRNQSQRNSFPREIPLRGL